ncbi:nitrite reductase small subunit NirD [Psychromarinibacter sp. C21-152]|uniref:Nitrite reductase small subunit NirD n=1 Tax=Psychromarinibacter sediminicola TaxID=3033385 RepID=A0AAE3TA63_9RHOB|nr:nitrite reductase small subunit NirD [Psychromarinibacter sediminicola]MDF0602528.1 nitrite reductase small subunit NirD [Psychromarinibacter sediminicola]
MTWIDIGRIDDIPVRGARLVKTHLGCIGLFRTADDEVFAAADTCPHKGGPLSEGIVHGQRVTCPLHNAVFDLNTGQGTDGYQIDTYPVRVENGRVLLDADALGKRSAA